MYIFNKRAEKEQCIKSYPMEGDGPNLELSLKFLIEYLASIGYRLEAIYPINCGIQDVYIQVELNWTIRLKLQPHPTFFSFK